MARPHLRTPHPPTHLPSAADLSSFDTLGANAHLYEPAPKRSKHGFSSVTSAAAAIAQHPDTIILCTWAGANSYQIGHYTSGYARLFPTSRILVVTSPEQSKTAGQCSEGRDEEDGEDDDDGFEYPIDEEGEEEADAADEDEVDLFYTPPATPVHNRPGRRRSLSTAQAQAHTQTSPLHLAALALLPTSYDLPVSRTLAFHPTPRRTNISTSRRGVLLHLFSTPGALQACALARAYRNAFAGRALDVQAVVFDSVPVLPRRAPRLLFRDGVAAGLVSVLDDVWRWVRGSDMDSGGSGGKGTGKGNAEVSAEVLAGLARDLADRSLLRQAPRHCYVFPERNAMELWRGGGESAVERTEWFVLRDRVDVEREDGCVNVDQRRYWAAIQELWVA